MPCVPAGAGAQEVPGVGQGRLEARCCSWWGEGNLHRWDLVPVTAPPRSPSQGEETIPAGLTTPPDFMTKSS